MNEDKDPYPKNGPIDSNDDDESIELTEEDPHLKINLMDSDGDDESIELTAKNPHQENSPMDSDDDDEIIELTQMVAIKPKDDQEISDTEAIGTAAFQKAAEPQVETDNIELKAEDEADLSDSDESPATELRASEGFFDLSELDSDGAGSIIETEDDNIASQIEASLGDDDDDLQKDLIGRPDEPDPIFEQNDDVIKLNPALNDPAVRPDPGEPITEKNEAVFDGEEEIELEYESDEDEYDFFALDDKKTFQEPETIVMANDDHDDPVEESIFFDPAENLGRSSDKDHEILTMDADPQEGTNLTALDDEDNFIFRENDDLPDLTDEMEFALDAENDENGLDTADDQPAENSDDIIARTVEKSLAPGEVTAQVDLAMLPEFEFTEDNDIMTEDDEPAAPEDPAATTMEEIRELAEEDYLPEFDDDIDLEFEEDEGEADIEEVDELELEDEFLPLEDFDEIAAGEEDDIIEITEFDHHFPGEDENISERGGILETADSDEYDDLELIEIEEDSPADDDKVADFSYSAEQNAEEEIDRFFSENLENAPFLDNEAIEAVEEIPALSTDMALATALTDDEDDEFDFRLDSSEISDQVDRLDTFLSEDSTAAPEAAALFEEPTAAQETTDDRHPAIEDAVKSLPITPDQIDSILERVISDKLSGKIEGIIYEVIEKAVSKEIDRLKGALLDNAGRGDLE